MPCSVPRSFTLPVTGRVPPPPGLTFRLSSVLQAPDLILVCVRVHMAHPNSGDLMTALRRCLHSLRRFGVSVLGVAVIVAGVILMPLPGPGMLVVLAGLGILATEFHWARRLLVWIRHHAQDAWAAAKDRLRRWRVGRNRDSNRDEGERRDLAA